MKGTSLGRRVRLNSSLRRTRLFALAVGGLLKAMDRCELASYFATVDPITQ